MLNEPSIAAPGAAYTDWFVDPTSAPVLYDPRFPNDSYFLQTKSTDKQYAVFAEATYAITDQYKLTLGGRYSRIKFTNDSLTGGPQLFLPPQTVHSSQPDNSSTPNATFSFQ